MLSIRYNVRNESCRNKKTPGAITKNKRLIGKYNWEGIHDTPEKNDWKKLEKIIKICFIC